MRRRIQPLVLALLLAGAPVEGAFYGSGGAPRPASKGRGSKRSPQKKTWAAADTARFTVPQVPTAAELREKADSAFAALPKSPDEARQAVVDAWDVAREEVRFRQVFAGFFAALVLSVSSITWTGGVIADYLTEGERGEVVQRALLFGSILDSVSQGYVEDNVDIDRLFQTGVNAMLSSLDPYSAYENAKQSEDLTMRTVGRYGGVGLTISRDDSDVVVLGALEGYAFDAGMRAGDKILSIDGQSVKGLPIDQVKTKLRGEPGSKVTVTVSRAGSPEPQLTFALDRQLVRLRDVPLAAMMPAGVGYVKLDAFSEGTADELAQAIVAFQRSGELRSLLIDLRDNPGGLLDAAVSVAQQLVPEDTTIVSTAGRAYGGEGSSVSYRSAMPPLLSPGVRLVLLVNGNTASAAEIVSGVVQDVDRGVIVGEKTFGKGLVQVVEPLPGGAALKLTVAKYYTPSGRCIQAISYRDGKAGGDEPAAAKGGAAGAPAKSGEQAAPDAPAGDAPAAPPAIFPDDDDDADVFMGGRRRPPQRVKEADKKTFYTRAGRAVKDGGGIVPDMPAEPRKVGELERILLQQGLFYRYAGEWLQAHRGAPAQQQQQLQAGSDAAYDAFVSFVKRESSKRGAGERPLLESPRLSAQLDALQKSLEASVGGSNARASKEVGVLRKMIEEEQLAQFSSERQSLQQDVVEAVLGRLTPPSERLLVQLDSDPQVKAALDLARNPKRYQQLLETPKDAPQAAQKSDAPEARAAAQS